MNRQVRAADGRRWIVRSHMNWVSPAIGDDFEHDVAPGYVSATVLGLVFLLLVVVLVAWTPAPVIVPEWLLLVLVIVLVALPIRWALRRPWTLVAEVPDSEYDDRPGERWVGTVRGMATVRAEASKVVRYIEIRSEPDIDGPLEPVE
jgi:hypothetical protein